jgi:hypothetical protein
MVCGWCHRSTLDRLESFGKKAPWRIFLIGADFSAPMVPRSGAKSTSMRAEFTLFCLTRTRGTLVA